MDLNAMMFIEAGLVAWGITCVTVAAHALRSASARPVDALRYE